MLVKAELIKFERDIADEFEAGHIHAPIHLEGGNEDALIEIFKDIKPNDYVFGTHRSHYKALLHGIPPELIKREILAGHSISLQFPDYHFFTSAIVGGICPIALGVAMTGQRTWCFIGDMAEQTGIFHECLRFAIGHNLPIVYVVENNGFSVDTPTESAWGKINVGLCDYDDIVDGYSYTRTFPHQGSGKWVTF